MLKTIGLICCLAVAFAAAAEARTQTKSSSTGKKTTKKVASKARGKKAVGKKTKAKKGAWKRRGQQSIAGDRTLQIQEALISAGYLKGEPSGKMDSATKQALIKLQGDNGWQTKVVPDSRALIKLGLGPDHSNLLNPDTAMLPGAANTAQRGEIR